MIDAFGRPITYLRVSVTDRCNLRCRYCMPPGGVDWLAHESILSYEEIADVVKAAAGLGIEKVRITGGEPLVRKDIEALVELLAGLPGISDLAMTTNGVLLAPHARALKAAGLNRVNISLDTTDPGRYRRITRGGDVEDVFRGIYAALAAGLTPVKLNCVVFDNSSEPDAELVRSFAEENGLQARFIRAMDTRSGRFSIVEGGTGGDCPRCNRLRLTSSGFVRPCLFSDLAFSVRELGPEQALLKAVAAKPEAGGPCSNSHIGSIGG